MHQCMILISLSSNIAKLLKVFSTHTRMTRSSIIHRQGGAFKKIQFLLLYERLFAHGNNSAQRVLLALKMNDALHSIGIRSKFDQQLKKESAVHGRHSQTPASPDWWPTPTTCSLDALANTCVLLSLTPIEICLILANIENDSLRGHCSIVISLHYPKHIVLIFSGSSF